ncbi:hypothetical protein H0A36_26490 [Endozoicomonas sp. SM1973]|uniref:DUF2127 domain-containing protein n=1 Tax=Spartinivicinus marinus TaxID=2994442 RepID=A0A853IG99_9GAMM|nr:hypothetical protein [Spartinivicinus marinus]MCX4030235.1 hypothetical protein [Spartinivicinus marinus]NYZ69568.1 hypothetical protein [Spartinivicinus marinus]
MSNRAIFRLAVIGLLVFELAISVALYFFDDGALDPAWEILPQAIDWQSYLESNLTISIIAGLSLIIVLLASLVGMLMFKSWGRWLYLISTLLIFPVTIVTGPTIYYGWEVALWDIVNMVNGAIMLAMFLPPISNEFNRVKAAPS